MKGLTAEWIEKADGDYATAERELRARHSPNYDAVCFHAQQVVEKF
jgi:HEPN domain-containing protein